MHKPSEKKCCLLIVQKNFHSLATFLQQALNAKGYAVVTANDIYPASIIGAILGKLQVPLIFKTTFKHFEGTYLRDKKYEVAIIIRGRGVSKSLINKMTKTIPRIIGYNWDTFNFNPAPLAWFRNVNKFYTFDYGDASKYELPILELFSAIPTTRGAKVTKYDLSAVGKNYPDRLKYIQRVLRALGPKRTYIRLHDHNVFYMLFNFLSNPLLYIKYRKYISLRPLSDATYLDAIGTAEFTIDYATNDQTGITMRCYESLSLQTKLITNNNYIRKSLYFNDQNTVIFTGDMSDEVFVNTYNKCRKTTFVGHDRDINAFVDDLLS